METVNGPLYQEEWKQKSVLEYDTFYQYEVMLKKSIFIFSYEKMISGMYMGEIARLAIERLRKNNLLFEGEGSYHLSTRGRFYTKYVSEIEG